MSEQELLKPTMRTTDIQRFRKCSFSKAKKVFIAAKSLDNDPFDLRPTEVPTNLVLEVLNLNRSFVLRQLEIKSNEKV